MSQVLVWRNDIPVTIDCDYDLTNSGIRHLCSIDNHVFVTAKNGNALYEGEIEEKEKKLFLKLTRSNICAIDITSTADKKLIYVNEDGRVFSAVPTFLDDQEEIVIEEDAKCCVHGHSTPRRRVRVKSVAASEQGILFVTTNGQLWALGLHSHLDVKIADGVKRVHYFKGRHVTAIACGLNFYLALVHKKCTNSIDDHLTDNESEAEDVFAYDCPNCISESTLSLLSHQSLSDICPLGLPLRKSSLDQSTSSTTSKGNYNDKKSLDETTSPSTEDEVIHRTQAYYAECSESIGDDGPVENGGSDEMISSINIDIDEKTDPLVETDAAEKKNTIFINTEVARQFLTRQLSWVSSCGNAGEEFLAEYTEGTTRIVRQNVSNVANLVYEGVRTVGDKVATLSRHVSGGSDSCNGNEESFEELSLEDVNLITPSLRFEDLLVSSSAGTSDHEVDGGERVEPSGDCLGDCVQGADLLGAEIYSWGSVRHGQLGIGDCMKRERPTLVSRLSGTGVQRIGCGLNHAVALTLDGRMFAWGANGSGQVDWQGSNSLSSPCQVMCGPVGGGSDRVWDIAAGARHSLVLTHGGDVFFIGRHKDGTGSGPVALSVPQPSSLEEGAVAQKELAAHGSVTWCSVHAIPVSPAVQDLALEQAFLEEGLLVQGSLVRPFQKSAGSSSQEHRMCETLCEHYSDILSFTALNASTLWEYARRGGDPSIVAMVQNVDEHIRVYKKYLEAACNVISLNGFSFMSSVVEPPPRVCELFLDRLPPLGVTKKGSKRNTAEATVKCALLHPLSRINVYKCIIQSLIRCNNSFGPPEPARTVALKRLQVSLGKWESFCEESDRQKREAEATRRFWESAGRIMESVRTPTRRLVRESRAHPIQVVNSGRFSSHWLILLTDVLVHVSGSVHTVHSLSTLWVEPHQDNDSSQHCLLLTMPEETQLLNAATPEDKVEWLQALQGSIHGCLCKPDSQMKALAVRHAVHTFTKAGPFKDAKYTGRWLNGKMHGWGRMEWPDGRVYIGQFVQNQQHGYGRLDMPTGDQYEGQWRDGSQNGRGVMKFACGDVYDGYFKDGQPHGHGVRKEGHFTASAASLYIGEWSAGAKHGYGVMDNICTGEKYLGSWSNNMKHGCGLIVTLDGIYYEGVFMQDVLTGHGVMVFEDGTHYEGEFRSAGCFNGKGVLTLNTGDRLEGILQGVWNDGVKVSGTLFKNPCPNTAVLSLHGKDSKPSSFGKLCVSPNQKWKSIFRQCLAPLVVPSTVVDIISAGGRVGGKNGSDNGVVTLDTQRLWASVAVAINTSRQDGMAAARARGIKWDRETLTEHLDTIPEWGRDHLDSESYQKLKNYLIKAFESPHHPLGTMLSDLTTAYTATYGGVRVHPLLLSHAVAELHSLVARLYEVVRLLFPALPPYGHELLLNGGDSSADSDDISDGLSKEEGEVVSASALLHPFMLPRVHAALFVLYALHNKAEDDAYWKRLLKWNKQPDMTLLAFLGIDQKFWASYSSEVNSSTGPKPPFSPLREQMFTEAVETLQQLKTTFSPLEKLLVIRSTFEQLTQAVKCDVGSAYLWTMDDLFPVFHFVVVRSRILQLGSEINFIEDFMERHLQNGELGIMFTTLKACYYQILQEKISPSS